MDKYVIVLTKVKEELKSRGWTARNKHISGSPRSTWA